MQMFAEIVRTLDQPEALIAEVADLGRRHVHYGVQDSQYDSVGTALLWTLERGLAPRSPRRSATPGPRRTCSSRLSCGALPLRSKARTGSEPPDQLHQRPFPNCRGNGVWRVVASDGAGENPVIGR